MITNVVRQVSGTVFQSVNDISRNVSDIKIG
jgi:hypothetical protein